MKSPILNCAGKSLDLSHPQIMGILNITPDSFCDVNKQLEPALAVERALQMVNDGAAIIDIGGEATSPQLNELNLSLQQEIDRVIPVIEQLSKIISQPMSIDTSRPEVMLAAIKAGAGFINDVRGLRSAGALEMAAQLQVPVCIMHMAHPFESNISSQSTNPQVIKEFLLRRREAAINAGIQPENIILDPGFGAGRFGKTTQENLQMMRELEIFTTMNAPLLVGISRKLFIGDVLKKPVVERLYGSIALAVIAAMKGAKIIRTHDVKETHDALTMVHAVKESQ